MIFLAPTLCDRYVAYIRPRHRWLRNSLSCRLRYSNPYIYICTRTCVILEGFEAESFSVKYQHPTFEYKIHSLKLTYIILNIYKSKIKCFEYFLPIHQAAQNGLPKSDLVRSMSLDIQILDPAI